MIDLHHAEDYMNQLEKTDNRLAITVLNSVGVEQLYANWCVL